MVYYIFLSVVIAINKEKNKRKEKVDMLACYIYPIPKGREYTETDLRNPTNVVELFGYCGILEGLITKEGWRFLVEAYGYERLYKMDKEALWNDSETIEEYIDWVMHEMEISPEY